MSFLPFALSFGSSALGGIFNAYGNYENAYAQTAAYNNTAWSNYNYNVARYNQEVQSQTYAYNARVSQYKQQVQFNNVALNEAYTQENRRLKDIFTQANLADEKAVSDFINRSGSVRASGRSGRSIDMLETVQLANFGRAQAIRSQSLENAVYSYADNTRSLYSRGAAANNQAWAGVAVPPMFAPPPQQPIMRDAPNRNSLYMSMASSTISALGNSFNLLPDSFFGLDWTLNT